MFGLFKKQTTVIGEKLDLKLSGMHCTSCSLNIDGELEETEGVISVQTSYAKSQTTINFDPVRVKKEKLVEVIEKLGYKVGE